MAVLKKHLTPLTKGGTITKHKGKGSRASLSGAGPSDGVTGGDSFSRSINDYAKQTPMANPTPDSDGDFDFGA